MAIVQTANNVGFRLRRNSGSSEQVTMDNSELIREFRDYLQHQRHCSDQTIRCYGADLEQFSDFLIDRPAAAVQAREKTCPLLPEVDIACVRSYMMHLEENQLSNSTIERKLISLRSFYGFLVKRGSVDSNPAMEVKGPRFEKKPPRYLDDEQIRQLLSMPAIDTFLGARDRAILETLCGTGMRAGELAALNLSDIDFSSETIHVRPNGRKERVVPVDTETLQSIRRYIELKDARAKTNDCFDNKVLFVNRYGKRLNIRSVRRKMDKYLQMAGLDMLNSPCTLRHSFARRMLKSGIDLRRLQKLMGHRSLSTTQIYSNVVNCAKTITKEAPVLA